MKNKKDLNIWLLVISLITIITLLLPFAKATEIGDVALWLKIEFYATLGIFIASIVVVAVLALISLIKDQFNAIRLIECFTVLAFVMAFVNVLVFGATKYKLNFGQIIVAVEALILVLFSQSIRLISGMKGYGKDFISLFKKAPKEPKEQDAPQEEALQEPQPEQTQEPQKDKKEETPKKAKKSKKAAKPIIEEAGDTNTEEPVKETHDENSVAEN